MKKLLITLLLISPFSFADWGDVYDCRETSSSHVDTDGIRSDNQLEKFQFKLSGAKKAMVFLSDHYSDDRAVKLRIGSSVPTQELWYANDEFGAYAFKDGKLMFSFTTESYIYSVTANCDKF
jgi:hypothetical protein